jgi:multiple sugar transport system permease protein
VAGGQDTLGEDCDEEMKRHSWLGQLGLVLPFLIPVVLFSVIPLLRGIYLGFTDYRFGFEMRFNGLENYRYMLTDSYFWSSFRVGAIWTIGTTLGQVALGLGLAQLLNADLFGQRLARILVLVPWAMPPVIRGLMWNMVFVPDTSGPLNHLLMQAGIINQPINWLGSVAWALPSIILVGIWGGLPQSAIVLLAGLQTIPKELYEAASLDGAGVFNQFRYVTLPSLKPIITSIVSLRFMWNFNAFGLVWTLTQGGPGGRTRLPMLFAYEEGFRYGNAGYAAALGNVMVLVVSLLVVLYIRRELKESEV